MGWRGFGHGDVEIKFLHPQLFYSAIYWGAGVRLFKSPLASKITSERVAHPVSTTTNRELKLQVKVKRGMEE